MGLRLVMLSFSGADNEVDDELEAQIAVYLARNKVHDALWHSPLAHTNTHRHARARAPAPTRKRVGCFATRDHCGTVESHLRAHRRRRSR